MDDMKRYKPICAFSALACAVILAVHAADEPPPPDSAAEHSASHANRSKKAFYTNAKYHPGIKLDYNLPSASIAIPAIYFGLADIGMNHEPHFYDHLAHVRMKGFEPTGISVVTGSYEVGGWQPSIVVVVNRENPIEKISVEELDGVFGAERTGGWVGQTWHPEFARGPEKNIRTWGQLGLRGAQATHRVNPYGYSIRYATALEFSNRVLQASERKYPLWGDQSFWVSVKPGTTMDPKVREFVRFVLSREGQELVQKDGKYLPLTPEIAAEELKKVH